MEQPEDLKDLVNIPASNLQEGFQQTPLREFIGNFENYEADKDERFDRVRIQLQFTDVEVIDTTEAYPFPIAQLSIPYSRTKRSFYGFLITSIDKLIPGGTLSSVLKKKLRMKMISENFGRWRGEETDRVMNCWNVVELVGEAPVGKTAHQMALELAVGKTVENLNSYYQEVFKNPAIKTAEGYRELAGKILNQSFIEEAIELGELIVDEAGLLALPAEEAS